MGHDFQVIIISAITSLFTLAITSIFKLFSDKYSLNYRLNKEFVFEQRKNIKQEISKNKILLLNSAEELNHRLWNLRENIDNGWHNIDRADWKNSGNYYLQSFAYRWLVFFHYILNTDNSILSFDSTLSSKSDILYIKFIKIFKNYFTDVELLKDFNYNASTAKNHFFKNNLHQISNYVLDKNDKVISFIEFKNKLKKGHQDIDPVLNYISTIENDYQNINYSVMKGFHLLIIIFLNIFGHDYQKTAFTKLFRLLISKYFILKNRKGYMHFIKKSKIYRIMFVYLIFIKK